MKIKIKDISRYNLIAATAEITYIVKFNSKEKISDDINNFFLIFKAFSFANNTTIDEDGNLVISGPHSSGDFSETIRDFRKSIFRALSSIANDISVDLDFTALPTKEEVKRAMKQLEQF